MKPCPYDTNGDGDCGKPLCPHCYPEVWLQRDNTLHATCTVCATKIGYIECPTGGWWAHETHPSDDHDAEPIVSGEPVARELLLYEVDYAMTHGNGDAEEVLDLFAHAGWVVVTPSDETVNHRCLKRAEDGIDQCEKFLGHRGPHLIIDGRNVQGM